MARIRTIKPSFWAHEQLGKMSPMARLTFLGLVSMADDDGRGRSHPEYLWGQLHPGQHPNVRRLWPGVLSELAQVQDDRGNLVYFYSVAGAAYYWIPGFKRQQRIDKPQPSALPPHPDSKAILGRFLEQSTLEGRGEEEEGRVMEREENGKGTPPHSPGPSALGTPEGNGAPQTPGTGGRAPAADDAAEIEATAHAFDAWTHPPLSKRIEAVEEMRGQGLTHEYIRHASTINDPKKTPFWDVVKALKLGRDLGRNGKQVKLPVLVPRVEAPPAPKKEHRPTPNDTRLLLDRRAEALAQVDAMLTDMDPEVLEDWTKDAKAEAIAKRVPAALFDAAVKSTLRVRCAKENEVKLEG